MVGNMTVPYQVILASVQELLREEDTILKGAKPAASAKSKTRK